MFNIFTKEMISPSIMVLLSINSAIGYGFKGDLKMTIYWVFAAGLTASLTYLK